MAPDSSRAQYGAATSAQAAKPIPVAPDLVEGDATDHPREPYGAADLVVDPRHARLVGSHVGAGDVVVQTPNGASERPHQRLPVDALGVGQNARLAAAVRQPGPGVLECHRAREAEDLFGGHVPGHAHPSDGGAARHVVHDHDRP